MKDIEKVVAFLSAMSEGDSYMIVATKRRDGNVVDAIRGVHGDLPLLQGIVEGLMKEQKPVKRMLRRAVKRCDNLKAV